MGAQRRSFLGRLGRVPHVMRHHYAVCRRMGASKLHAARVALLLAWMMVRR